MPLGPPVMRTAFNYPKVNLNTSIVALDPRGHQFELPRQVARRIARRNRFELGLTIKNAEDVDISIEAVLVSSMETLQQRVDPTMTNHQIEAVARELSQLQDALYMVRYHQRQFFYRLFVLQSRHHVWYEPVSDNLALYYDDMPLRFELEAFFVFIRTFLDVLARLILVAIGEPPLKYDKFIRALEKPDLSSVQTRLKNVFDSHARWIDKALTIRNSIMHEADFSPYQGFHHRDISVFDPVVDDESAERMAFRVWRDILRLVNEAVGALRN